MKDRTVMRADLRTDLKDSGALWSDAELNRAIEKAVSDLSRYLPRERLYEEILEFDVTSESITFPKTTSATYIVNAVTFNGKTAGSTFTISAQPDVPRVVSFLVTDADDSMTDWHIRIHGVDEDDLGCTEDFYHSRGKTQTGEQVFKRIDKIELVEAFTGSAAAGDTLSIGIGAYTSSWKYLAYKPVKQGSETITEAGSTTCARNTDYEIDYVKGRVRAISGGKISAEEVCSITYKKDQTAIDLTNLDDFIRVYRVEYPVGDIPQTFCQFELYGRYLWITGQGESDGQVSLSEGKQVRVYFDAIHHPPTDYGPGTIPEFLENTVLMAAAAYALYVYSLKCEHQSITDMATARTAITNADAIHATIATKLTTLEGYLTSGATALSLCPALHAAIITALDAANAYLDAVATDLSNADGVRANYMGATHNYVNGGAEPDVLAYLTSGDALLNTIAKGGENEQTPNVYKEFALAVKNALVGAFEQDRAFYQQDGTARTNAALAYIQEASQRIQNIQADIAEAAGYNELAATVAREIDAELTQITNYLSSAAHSIEVSSKDLDMADKFRTEAENRLSEVYNIWRDRKQYIGDFAASAMRQIATGE